jgi:anti-sigma factor RsiW
MSCGEQTAALLHAYVDGEMDVVRSLEMERHLSECERCSADLKSYQALRSALGDVSLYFDEPKDLEKRVRAKLAKAAKVSTDGPVLAWRRLAAAASLAVMAILAWALIAIPGAPSREALVNQEIVSAHVRSLMADHLTDVPSSDQHTVKPWFNGRLDFSPEVRDLSGDGYPLVGGRLDYLDGRGVAALVYQRRKHAVNVFVWPAPDGSGAGQGEAVIRGYNVIRWRRSGTSYAAVSDLNLAELRELVRDLQR